MINKLFTMIYNILAMTYNLFIRDKYKEFFFKKNI